MPEATATVDATKLEGRIRLLENIRLTPPALGSSVPLAAVGTLLASCGRGGSMAGHAQLFGVLLAVLFVAIRLTLGALRRKNLAEARATLAVVQAQGATPPAIETR